MRKLILLCAVFAFATAPATFARGGLAKWKDWDQSPQGCFMTKAERAEWATNVKTDADAEKFVHDFLAKRPAAFEKDVTDRAAQADKYLTIGKLAGSKTTRGKIVILLGPPQGLDVTNVSTASQHHENQAMNEAMTNINSSGGGSDGGRGGGAGSGATNVASTYVTGSQVRMYHFTYSGEVAKKVDRNTVDLTVEADPNTGKDRLANRADEQELDLIQEQLAQASLKK